MKDLKNAYGIDLSDMDAHEPPLGHHQRFMQRLDQKPARKKRFAYGPVLAVAALLLVMFGLWMGLQKPVHENALAKLSPQNREAQQYFNRLIEKELASLKSEETPEVKPIVDDALRQLHKLDADYTHLMKELSDKGESSQLIHAMIINLQTRIAFLERVSTQIENIRKLKANHHENQSM